MAEHKPLTTAILGGGGRGSNFSEWLKAHPDFGRVVAIAEPITQRRTYVADMHQIPADMQFERWEDVLAKPRLADAVLNMLPDRLHVASAIKALELGYHMMLEKPMATSLEDCERIHAAHVKAKTIVSVCHSLRYHTVYAEAKRMVDAGAIGRLITFEQLEAVEPIHQSHSFVRGNWGNQGRSTFMLLAKSCHDIDILAYFVKKDCLRVSSFGALTYFKEANAPAGAPKFCVEGCPVETECPYYAPKVYIGPSAHWGTRYLLGKTDQEKLEELKTSPYGRCVFRHDNDVVDHQVVGFEFDDDITGTFTMTAFAYPCTRRLRLNGTLGELQMDLEARTIDLLRFSDHARSQITVPNEKGGHGGADNHLIRNFIYSVWRNDQDHVLTGTAESLRSHRIAFAAEKARLEKRVVEIAELENRVPKVTR